MSSKTVEFSLELSLCAGCSRVHLDFILPQGDAYSLPLDDDQWDDLFIRVAKIKRARDQQNGIPFSSH